MRQVVAETVRPTGERTKADLPTQARHWAGPLFSSKCPSLSLELGDAADLLGVLVRLSLDGPSRFIGDAHRQLRNALVGVDHLLQAAPPPLPPDRPKLR